MLEIEPRIEGSASARWWSVSFPDALVKITVNRLDDSNPGVYGASGLSRATFLDFLPRG